MVKRRYKTIVIALTLICILTGIISPIQISGKVGKITETEDKLAGITEEEKKVLEELFKISQKMEELNKEKEGINKEITKLNGQLKLLSDQIDTKQKDYDLQLGVLKQVLVNYQRGGPATYLEILLKAKNLSGFLKSINVIKDISHNMKKLLTSLEEGKKELEREKKKLDSKAEQLALKKEELANNLRQNEVYQKEKQDYLNALYEDKKYYEGQLSNLETMWLDCQTLFPKLAKEIMNTINDGYFTLDDLNMDMGLFHSSGYIEEDTFNELLAQNSKLTKTTFHFEDGKVILSVPEEHLELTGNFVIDGECAIRYEVISGTFYQIPLEPESIKELFANGPLKIDFKSISEGIISVEFTLDQVECQKKKLTYKISTKF